MKISVCMTSCNGEKYIAKQIESIIPQLDIYDELIISDDSSKDNTLEIIKRYKDDRITVIENNTFKSPIFNIENALKSATGEIIYLSDQDDIWLDNKVETMKHFLKQFDLVVSDCIVIDGDENVLVPSFFKLMNSKRGFIYNMIRNKYLGCCMAFNRKILNLALPFPKNIPMHDIWIGMIGEVYGKPYFCKEKLVKYRRHEENISSTSYKSTYSFIEKARFRKSIIINLIKLALRKKTIDKEIF